MTAIFMAAGARTNEPGMKKMVTQRLSHAKGGSLFHNNLAQNQTTYRNLSNYSAKPIMKSPSHANQPENLFHLIRDQSASGHHNSGIKLDYSPQARSKESSRDMNNFKSAAFGAGDLDSPDKI